MKSIGIIGAGLMGRVVAINAINNGYQTTLFEKKDLSIHLKSSFVFAVTGFVGMTMTVAGVLLIGICRSC